MANPSPLSPTSGVEAVYFSTRLDSGNAHSREKPNFVAGAAGEGGGSTDCGYKACGAHSLPVVGCVAAAIFVSVKAGASHAPSRTLTFESSIFESSRIGEDIVALYLVAAFFESVFHQCRLSKKPLGALQCEDAARNSERRN
jgi:hypothetical protein